MKGPIHQLGFVVVILVVVEAVYRAGSCSGMLCLRAKEREMISSLGLEF